MDEFEVNGIKYSYGVGYHPVWCRWWLKSRIYKKVKCQAPYFDYEIYEWYIPWWAWPLEILHRILFGSSKFIKDDNVSTE